MYIFGGFSGLLLNDVLTYTPPSCLAFSNPDLCAAAGPGIRCHWVKSRCVPWEPKPPEHTFPAPFCPARPGMPTLICSSDSFPCIRVCDFLSKYFQHILPKTCSTITHKCCSQEVYPSMRVIIILKDLASEVCLHIIIIGAEGQRCNNYLILK